MGASGGRRDPIALASETLRDLVSHTHSVRILVDSFADAGLPNAQMANAREIVSRLDPDRFHVSMFAVGKPDPRIAGRKNTRLVQLPQRRQSVRILSEFVWGTHEILFYMKPSPASRWYQELRKRRKDYRITVGTVESQSNLKDQPTINQEAIRLYERTVLRCDYLFSNAANVQKSLWREYGLESEIIPTGVDTQFFSPGRLRPPNERVRVLFVGSLRGFKQPHFLLSAASRFPYADFRIAGDGPLRPELEQRIAREWTRNVVLLGPLAAEQLRDAYRSSDIFLFPSLWEGSPKVILEAAACGLPVIARKSYLPETVLHGVTGFQAGSDDELYSALGALIAKRDLRLQMGAAGRQHSLEFDWGLITAQWAETFLRLTNRQEMRQAS
jgi:glycosyltransferase involved in cell wall biosynthesis